MSSETQQNWREEQAKREIGQTDFQPGLRATITFLFLLAIVIVPLAQFVLPSRLYERLSGHGLDPSSLRAPMVGAVRITATVAAISAPPDQGAVYRDFIMRLHLTDVVSTDGTNGLAGELLLGVMGMRDRVIQPVAALAPGARIVATVQPWSEVAARLDGINGSQLAEDRFLTMPQVWGDAVAVEGQAGQPRGGDFMGVWWGRGGSLPADARVPLVRGMRQAWDSAEGWLDRALAANGHLARRIALYEKALDDGSIPALALRPPVQALLAMLGVGNEKAFVGRAGWLFYAPGIDSLTGPGFLDPGQLRRRARTGGGFAAPLQPDPRPAILVFRDQLAARGIELVLMPTPVKPTIHPEMFTARLRSSDQPVRNPSFVRFADDMRAAGVRIFDPAPLLKARALLAPQYLATDTHWRPEAMRAVAEALAGELAPGLSGARIEWQTRPETHTQLGDIATMLAMSDWQRAVKPETVEVQRVIGADGADWKPDPAARVLLLGDSFANIYSLDGMGWGEGAGLAEHLARALGRSVNRLTRNDAGAHASRRLLADALKRDPDFLAATRVVVWQFAERELAVGDWQAIALPPAPAGVATSPPDADSPDVIVTETDSAPEAYARLFALAETSGATVVVGRDDWLFLAAELRHLANPPLPHAVPATPESDPFSALVDFHRKLAELGIDLILLPVPPRAVVYPDRLFARVPLDEHGTPLRLDAGLQAFYRALSAEGVRVLDLTDAFLAARRDDATLGPVCCEQDTHWSPRGLTIAAAAAADALRQLGVTGAAERVTGVTRADPVPLVYAGDLVDRVPGHPAILSTTTVTRIVQVGSAASAIAADPSSPVILLADSHGLVFSIGGDMHAEGAGLGEQLAFELGMPLDIMARRGSGDAVRRDLARRFLQDPAIAPTKRAVVYCFAARTLTEAQGWKPVPLRK